ncbi:MAG: hypothetical protein RIR00_176 [Pseudomonadota bacterium]
MSGLTAAPGAAPAYRGRFAPSPTGALHFGSLIAAVGSYLEARSQGGEWGLRIEDVDTPRNVPGADLDILRTLEAFGFEWDGEVVWQSQRRDAYAAALAQLQAAGLAYPCACSRKEIAALGRQTAIDGGLVYPGRCRDGLPPTRSPRAWRLRTEATPLRFHDAIQGEQQQCLERDVGDFVLLRADGPFAYQLAVVVDDGWQGITHVVRGADLLDSTPRQIHLQRCLGLPQPEYAHLPVAVNAAGEKLSKQTLAPALNPAQAPALLWAALDFLNQAPPKELQQASLPPLWDWAIAHWRCERISGTRHQPPSR